MKVTDNPQVANAIRNSSPSHKDNKSPAFSDVLAKTASETNINKQSAPKVTQTQPVNQLWAVQAITNDLKMEATENIGEILSLLEQLQSSLAGEARNSKPVSILADDLEKAAYSLNDLGKELPDGHKAKELINRTAILAVVESAKFKRGDYV